MCLGRRSLLRMYTCTVTHVPMWDHSRWLLLPSSTSWNLLESYVIRTISIYNHNSSFISLGFLLLQLIDIGTFLSGLSLSLSRSLVEAEGRPPACKRKKFLSSPLVDLCLLSGFISSSRVCWWLLDDLVKCLRSQ